MALPLFLTRTISQIKWIWLLLSWIRRMNVRFSSVSFTPPVFFLFPSCFCSLSVWRAHPKYHTFRTALSSPKRWTFPDQARVAAHRPSHLARLLICSLILCHGFIRLHYGFILFTSSTSFAFRYDHYYLPHSPSSHVSPLVPYIPYPSNPSPFHISQKHPAS